MKPLSISVTIPTLNSSRTLEACLKSLREQDYPQDLVEILIIDGGSTDDTFEISKKYSCVFINGGYKDNQEPRKAIGLHKAKNDLIACIDSDNALPNKNWFTQMVRPLLDNPKVVGAQTWKYSPKKEYPIFSRYCALIGANDPVVLYLGKSEKVSWNGDLWKATEIAQDKGDYFLVRLTEDNFPTVGGNGFLIYRDILLKSQCAPKDFFHLDVVLDVVRKGHDLFAVVRNEIDHDTAATLANLAKRRTTYFEKHNPIHSNRRFLVFDSSKKKDLINLGLFVFYSLTLVQPLFFAMRGYLKKRDVAWFLHPWVCLNFVWAYGVATIRLYLKRSS